MLTRPEAGCAEPATATVPTGLLVGAGSVAMIAASLVAGTLYGPDASLQRLVVLAVSVLAFGLITRNPAATFATAGIGWLFLNGFLVDRYGELGWHGAPDIMRLLVLVAASSGSFVSTSPRGQVLRSSSGQETQRNV